MKLKHLLLVLFFLNMHCYAQNYKITYGKEIKAVFAEKTIAANTNMKAINNAVVEEAKNIKYSLYTHNNTSVFQVEEAINNNSYFRMASIFGGTTGSFYLNKNKEKAVNIKEVSGEKFQVTLDVKKWEIHKETKQIGKYTCYKATGIDLVRKNDKVNKIPVTVWFCPELPSYFGPAGYFGLPGTILRVEKRNTTLYATHIEEIKINRVIKIPNKGIKITEAELYKIAMGGTPDFGVGN